MAGGGAEAVWEADVETNLFRALIKHKPVGVHRHMRMVQLHQMLLEDTGRDVPIPEIWDHLGELYDLPALEELAAEDDDPPPGAPNFDPPIDFQLPLAVVEAGLAAAERVSKARGRSGRAAPSAAGGAGASPATPAADDDGRRGSRRVARAPSSSVMDAPSPAAPTKEKSPKTDKADDAPVSTRRGQKRGADPPSPPAAAAAAVPSPAASAAKRTRK